jgi:hypothetical protein
VVDVGGEHQRGLTAELHAWIISPLPLITQQFCRIWSMLAIFCSCLSEFFCRICSLLGLLPVFVNYLPVEKKKAVLETEKTHREASVTTKEDPIQTSHNFTIFLQFYSQQSSIISQSSP